MRLVLLDNGFEIDANLDVKYKMVISVSKGDIRFDEIKSWIQTHIRNKNEA